MMARHIVVAGLVYLALVLQPSLGSDPRLIAFQPWLPGLALVACILLTAGAARLVWTGLLGLGVDCLSGDRLGVQMIVVTLVASSLIVMQTDGRSPGVPMIGMFVFVGTVVWRSGVAIVHGFLDHQEFDLDQFVMPALREGISTTVLAIGVLLTVRLLIGAIRPKRASSVPLSNRWSMLTGD